MRRNPRLTLLVEVFVLIALESELGVVAWEIRTRHGLPSDRFEVQIDQFAWRWTQQTDHFREVSGGIVGDVTFGVSEMAFEEFLEREPFPQLDASVSHC